MSFKRKSKLVLFDKGKRLGRGLISIIRKRPSPENMLLVKSKIDLLSSFRETFESEIYGSRNLTPARSNAVVPKIKIKELNIKNYGLGDNRAQVLSNSIRSVGLETLNLKSTGVREAGTLSILTSINTENLKVLDLSSNKIGLSVISSLRDLLVSPSTSLEELNLENVKIDLKNLGVICGALKKNTSLKYLNLANNSIGISSGILLADMLKHNDSIERLDLQWNFIKGLDIIILAQGVKANDSLKTLDLSWNSIGQDKIHQSIFKIFKDIFDSESLEHLDISHNNFSLNDTEIISGLIKGNHTIKGLHFEGNYGLVDALGFIHSRNYISINSSMKQMNKICSRPAKSNCWICSNWTDCKFEWDPSLVIWNRKLKHFALSKLDSQIEPVFIHLEVDEYKPFLLKQQNGLYVGIRALPPGKIRFFFTYRGVAQISNEYKFEVINPVKQFCQFYPGFSKEVMAVVVNYFIHEGSDKNCIPRPDIEEYKPPPGDVPEPDIPEWSIETSIFAGFKRPEPDLYRKCFEADWTNSKLSRLVKSDVSRLVCKDFLRDNYEKMYFTYKSLVGLSSNNGFFSVTLNTLTDFYQQKTVFDKTFKLSDLDLNIKACTTASNSTQSNNAFSVVRHEFLELQARIAVDKYLRKGLVKTELEALQSFLMSNVFAIPNPFEWKINRLFNEECDTVLTNNKELFSAMFEWFKGKVTGSKDRRLCEEDFMFMIQENGMLSDKFTARYGHLCFHLSLATRVDEINGTGFMLAGFYEFIEAFCRVCDMMDTQDVENDILKGFCNGEIGLDKKVEQALVGFSYLKARRGRR